MGKWEHPVTSGSTDPLVVVLQLAQLVEPYRIRIRQNQYAHFEVDAADQGAIVRRPLMLPPALESHRCALQTRCPRNHYSQTLVLLWILKIESYCAKEAGWKGWVVDCCSSAPLPQMRHELFGAGHLKLPATKLEHWVSA